MRYAEMQSLLVVCLVLLCCFVEIRSDGCSLSVGDFDGEYMPILIDNSTSRSRLILPRRGVVELGKGDKINLVCPNPRNTLNITHTNSTIASCVKGKTFKILKQNSEITSISCKRGVRGVALATRTICADGSGKIIRLGFPTPKEFLSLIDVCYDKVDGRTFYATHQLIGSEIDYSSKSSFRPGFSTQELGPEIPANVAYKQVYQKSNFDQFLGSSKLANKYINRNSFLARGHLAPNADFLFAAWQCATFFYVNAVPQWQQINNGNWKKLEMLHRRVAIDYDQSLQVYTGTYEILRLLNSKNVKTDMYMTSGKKIPIPKFIWKILYAPTSNQAIAFISLNNPYANEVSSNQLFCEDICENYGWQDPSWKDIDKGFIFCCDARELLEVISTGPSLKIRGILRAPSS